MLTSHLWYDCNYIHHAGGWRGYKKNNLNKLNSFVSDIRRGICMYDTPQTEITGVGLCFEVFDWEVEHKRKFSFYKGGKKNGSCPLGKQTECDQDVGRAAGTSFEDKTEQWTIWIMYCSTRMTENKHCLSRCSCHAWISWLLSQESLKAVSLQERGFMYVFVFLSSRVKLKEGVTFLGARPSNPTQWIVSQDVRSEGHRVVTLHCRRKESGFDQQRSVKNVLDCSEELRKKSTSVLRGVGVGVVFILHSVPNGRCVNFRKMWLKNIVCAHNW